jgi:hypothetical protein
MFSKHLRFHLRQFEVMNSNSVFFFKDALLTDEAEKVGAGEASCSVSRTEVKRMARSREPTDGGRT